MADTQANPTQSKPTSILRHVCALALRSPQLLLRTLLIGLIPIVGPLYILGIALEWSRRVVWGHTGTVTAQDIPFNVAFKSGLRGFGVALCYAIVLGVGLAIISEFYSLDDTIPTIVSYLLQFIINLALLNAALYQRFSKGFNLSTVASDLTRNWKRTLSAFAAYVLINIIVVIIILPALITAILNCILFFNIFTSLDTGVLNDLARTFSVDYAYGVSDALKFLVHDEAIAAAISSLISTWLICQLVCPIGTILNMLICGRLVHEGRGQAWLAPAADKSVDAQEIARKLEQTPAYDSGDQALSDQAAAAAEAQMAAQVHEHHHDHDHEHEAFVPLKGKNLDEPLSHSDPNEPEVLNPLEDELNK